MTLPFTQEQFMTVFRNYNLAVWPAQIVAYVVGLSIIYLTVRKTRYGDKIIFGMLSLMWLWNGFMYHIKNFSTINKAAYLFGTMFIIQGILFLAYGVLSDRLAVRFNRDVYATMGGLFIVYAMVIYPSIGYFLGHVYPQSPSFGIAPCPTTIFTFGILLLANRRLPLAVLWIPLAWSVISMGAAFSMGILEDLGLLIAGVTGTLTVIIKNRRVSFTAREILEQ